VAEGQAAVDGGHIAYLDEGPRPAPALLLSNSLGATVELWRQQVGPWSRALRVIRYDTRGHGRSPLLPGEPTLERLGRDALAVLDAAGVARAHVCGLSLGGMTAMWLARHAPQRVGRLVLANTAARLGTVAGWEQRRREVQEQGMDAIAESGLRERWFTPGFDRRSPTAVATRAMLAACPPQGYLGGCAALRDADLGPELAAITAPTLVVVGSQDRVTPPADGETLRRGIPGARLVTLEAAHLSNLEQPEAFTAAVLEFLTPLEPPPPRRE
jgi:3-oxoadipate enol-lactonase